LTGEDDTTGFDSQQYRSPKFSASQFSKLVARYAAKYGDKWAGKTKINPAVIAVSRNSEGKWWSKTRFLISMKPLALGCAVRSQFKAKL
jgi:hypothetical protein